MAANLEYYKVFYYVAKYKNMTKAAAALMSNQPNVTRVMNLLEAQLGCRLIVRSNRGITLTAEGQQLYAHVSSAFEQIQMGEQELEQAQFISGPVKLRFMDICWSSWVHFTGSTRTYG